MANGSDDTSPLEDECRLVGGPYDGQTVSLPREQTEYALPAEAASLIERLGEMLGDVRQLAKDLEDFPSDTELLEALDGNPDDDDQEYAQPAPGGVLYRRQGAACTFHFVGHISVAELQQRQNQGEQ